MSFSLFNHSLFLTSLISVENASFTGTLNLPYIVNSTKIAPIHVSFYLPSY